MNEFRDNTVPTGGLGNDIYQAVAVSLADWSVLNFEHFKDNCGNCKDNCFVTGTTELGETTSFPPAAIYHGCARTVNLTGFTSDDTLDCATPASSGAAGLCGTLKHIVTLDPQPSRISIGIFGGFGVNFPTTVYTLGVQVTKELQVIGLLQELGIVFVGPFTDVGVQYGFSVSNGVELSLNQLTLKYMTQGSAAGVENPHFVDVRGVGSVLTISSCSLVGQDNNGLSSEGVVVTVVGAFSETFAEGTTRIVDLVAANITFTNTYGGLFRVVGGNLLLRALAAISLKTSAGSGAVVHAYLGTNNWLEIDEATFVSNASAPFGSGGAIWLNLSVGSQVRFASAIFVDCVSGGRGGAVYIYLPVQEVERLNFFDVRFRNNKVSDSISNVHLAFPTRVAFPCFTLFILGLQPHNLSQWNISDGSGAEDTNLAALLAECDTDPCSSVSPDICGTEISPTCVPTHGAGGVLVGCETNDCVDRAGHPLTPPCGGRCIVSLSNASRCILDGCETYSAEECPDHAAEGCSVSGRHCVMVLSNVSSYGSGSESLDLNQISIAVGATATNGAIRVGPGRFVQTPFEVGWKTLIIAGSGMAPNTGPSEVSGAGTTIVAAGVYGRPSATSPLLTARWGASLDIINLTLDIRTTDSPSLGTGAAAWSSSAPLILVIEGRLVLYDVSVAKLILNDSILLAERPVEFAAVRVWFTDILLQSNLPGRTHGGAALALDFQSARNALGTISSCSFTNVSSNFYSQLGDALDGGAVWVQSSGIGHKIIVEDTIFLTCSSSLSGGAMKITSTDNSLIAVVEDVIFRNCTGYSGGGLVGAARPLHLHNATFENCTAQLIGGGFYQDTEGDVYLVDCVFNQSSGTNLAPLGVLVLKGGGGCSLTTFGAVFIHGTVFEGCSIKHSGSGGINNGSALFISNSLSVVISVTNFTNCGYEPQPGTNNQFGTLSIQNNADGQTLLDRCQFINNRARNGGGALNLATTNVTVRLCTFQGNSADFAGGTTGWGSVIPAGSGGGWYVSGGSVLSYIGGSTFTSNTHKLAGAGQDIYIIADPTTGQNTKVTKNCYTSVGVSAGAGVNPFASTASECPATADATAAISAGTAQQVQEFLRYSIADAFTVSLTTAATGADGAYALSSVFVLTETVTIQSGVTSLSGREPYILANNSLGNLFTISTGSFTVRHVHFLVARVLAQDSVIRTIEQSTILIDGVTFKRLPPAVSPFEAATATTTAAARSRSRAQANQATNPWAFEGALLTFEQGTLTITDSVFDDFVFQGDGHAISVTAEHHHASTVVIKNTNFTNIRSTYSQHVGVCIYAELRSSQNTLALENVIFDRTTINAIGIIVPSLSFLSNVLTVSGVSFTGSVGEDVNAVEGTRVYIGTLLTLQENTGANDICTNTSLLAKVDGFFGESNTGLCIGEAEVCGFALPTAIYRKAFCPADAGSTGDEQGDNGDGGSPNSKSAVNGGVVAAIVILAILVVVLVVVAILLVLYFRKKSEGFQKILNERKDSVALVKAGSNKSVSAAEAAAAADEPAKGVGVREKPMADEDDDIEEEIEEDESL